MNFGLSLLFTALIIAISVIAIAKGVPAQIFFGTTILGLFSLCLGYFLTDNGR